MPRLKLVGWDPSLRNWGLAAAYCDSLTGEIELVKLALLQPVLNKGKQVRQNSLDLQSAEQLYAGAMAMTQGAHAVFGEVPVGSQSARAMASYGICVGVLGSLRASGIPFFDVTASEVKLATGQKKTASKDDMIQWATTKYPKANWLRYAHSCAGRANSKGEIVGAYQAGEPTGDNEHLADAVAAIHAGINLQQFKQLLSLKAA